MKQFKLSFLLTVLMSMVGARAMAHDFEVRNADGVIIYYLITGSDEVAVSYGGPSKSSYSNNYSGNVDIPESVTYNGTTYKVTSIGDNAFCGSSDLTSVTIPNSVKKIGYDAFCNCYNLTSITIPNSVESIDGDAFNGTAWLKNQPNGLVYAGKVAYIYKGNMPGNTSIVIEDGTLGIADGAFSNNCSGLTSITIPNSVTNIGGSAFNGCSGLTSIIIPNGVMSIGSYAFSRCNSLTDIIIPNSVSSVGEAAFNGTPWYNNQPDGLVYAGKVAYKYKGTMPENTTIVIKDGTLEIADYAFDNCYGLTSVHIPNSVTTIGKRAFYYCGNLPIINIPNSVMTIGEGAFRGCYNLISIEIPNSVKIIENNTFSSCQSLTSVIIPKSVTSIGNAAFSDCRSLTSITIPNSVKTIGNGAFGFCISLTSVNILSGVTSIGESAFAQCSGLTSITIPNSVLSIGRSAFAQCSSLNSITIPNSVVSIGSSAFNETPWYNNQPDGLVYAGKVVYQYKGNMPQGTNIVINEGTLGIASWAFINRSSLNSIFIPNSMKSIGENAFAGCSSLTSITIPNSVKNIGSSAFQNCSSLKSITIPNSVTTIESYTFDGCSGLTLVTIPKSVLNIDNYAFQGCKSLISVFIECNTPLSITKDVFPYVRYTATLYVPAGSKTAYEAEYNWKEKFKEIVELTNVSILDDAIYVEEAKILKSGGILTICLKNMQATNAYSFDLKLPFNVTIDNCMLSDRHNGHTVNYDKWGKIAVLSLQSKDVSGNSGAILTLKLNVYDDVVVGDYGVKVVNAKYSLTSGSTSVALPETVSRLTIENYMKGDVNGDGEVDIADAVCIVNHVVGKRMPLFATSAADVNLDAEIDIADAVRIVNLVVGKIDTLSRSAEMELNEINPQ